MKFSAADPQGASLADILRIISTFSNYDGKEATDKEVYMRTKEEYYEIALENRKIANDPELT